MKPPPDIFLAMVKPIAFLMAAKRNYLKATTEVVARNFEKDISNKSK
jgi:hypothetical protein